MFHLLPLKASLTLRYAEGDNGRARSILTPTCLAVTRSGWSEVLHSDAEHRIEKEICLIHVFEGPVLRDF